MKWLAIVFSLYTFLMSCVPCTDEAFAMSGNSTTTIAADQHESHSVGLDLCSPLCICSCCGGFVINGVQKSPTFAYWLTQTVYSVYDPLSIPELYYSIWQPPKA